MSDESKLGQLGIYVENDDMFIVRALDVSDDEMTRYRIHVVKAVRNDPSHHIQYGDGDGFIVSISKVIPGAKACQDWELYLPKDSK